MATAWKGIWHYAARIPSLAELPAAPKRGILHWTAGSGTANEGWDRPAYHYLFEQPSGHVVEGHHTVAANMKSLASSDKYAAHTGGLNSYSVGFSFCGMRDAAKWSTFGPYPLKEEQVLNGLQFVGLCLWMWGLDPLNPKHLFTHMEAWTLHGVKGQHNHEKFDIGMLPWLKLPPTEVGDYLRQTTAAQLAKLFPEPTLWGTKVQDRAQAVRALVKP